MIMRVRQTHELRGIPLWLLKAYLQELGGVAQGNAIAGPGWHGVLTQLEDFQVGSIRVGQVRLELEIDNTVLAEFNQALEKKILRAGG